MNTLSKKLLYIGTFFAFSNFLFGMEKEDEARVRLCKIMTGEFSNCEKDVTLSQLNKIFFDLGSEKRDILVKALQCFGAPEGENDIIARRQRMIQIVMENDTLKEIISGEKKAEKDGE